MILIENKEKITDIWENIIYLPKQLRGAFLDLTIKKLFRPITSGSIDFGGSEYSSSEKEIIIPKIETDPKYGWWTLEEGIYIVEYNENLVRSDFIACIFPHKRLLSTGCYHPTFIVNSKQKTPFQGILIVGGHGVRIKENACISTAITYSTA